MMKGDPTSRPQSPKSRPGKAGPQGTQVFSRDQIAELLDEHDDDQPQGHRASLLVYPSDPAEDDKPRVFPLTADRLTIGRSPVCDVRIEEASISSEHARMVRSDDGWRIVNLLSTNGVFVNEEKVFSHRLDDGDEIRLGRTMLRFHDPAGRRDEHRPNAGLMRWLPWALIALAALGLAAWLL